MTRVVSSGHPEFAVFGVANTLLLVGCLQQSCKRRKGIPHGTHQRDQARWGCDQDVSFVLFFWHSAPEVQLCLWKIDDTPLARNSAATTA